MTQQWLNTERQTSQLKLDWQASKPLLSQRLSLLKAEQKQLQSMLKTDQDNQQDVTVKRTELMRQQSVLELQQNSLIDNLSVLVNQLEHISSLLPPPLLSTWHKQQSNLLEASETSILLQEALAKLSSVSAFDKRISIHEAPLSLSNSANAGDAIMVKQLYLGLGFAWFVSADGQFAGRGQVVNDTWHWQYDASIDASEIQKSIAMFEKTQQAELVQLPLQLAGNGGATPLDFRSSKAETKL